jgi:hypothetical protein
MSLPQQVTTGVLVGDVARRGGVAESEGLRLFQTTR